MAFSIKLDYVTTTKREAIKGLAYPFASGDGGYASQVFDEQAIIDAVTQLVLTNKGERVMYPDIGTTLKSRIFSPLDEQTVQEIKSELVQLMATYEPRVFIKGIRVGSPELGDEYTNSELRIQLLLGFTQIPGEEQIDVIITPNA